MNIIEKQTELGKSLYEINTNTLKELATLQQENVEKYFETNRSFSERLPTVKNISDFVSLQREYGETLWANAKEAMESQNEIVKSAFEHTTEALKSVFTAEEADAVAPTKTKAKAKKPVKEAA